MPAACIGPVMLSRVAEDSRSRNSRKIASRAVDCSGRPSIAQAAPSTGAWCKGGRGLEEGAPSWG
eukprot:CAMPEP_0196586456 /NCGR_PEP_ID=MMETSP1081-20130531/54366_1 /TAXON_ID=36882 /ORGANISM="Pyramimonas amylifera, Strain CCMP720" /LENGTH=64 /DNA_ID=CAMNT_0041908349 /DNA_START=272 /DNA_END=466 /DNA_ORIENTATION=+